MNPISTAAVLMMLTTGCGSRSGLPTATVQVGGHAVDVEIAATPESRQLGLMHRDSLGTNDGMLFVYPDGRPRGFWMKDTRIPLSIAYADKNGTIVRIKDMTPFSTERVPSINPATYALEMNQGWFEANGVKKGDTIGPIPDVEVR